MENTEHPDWRQEAIAAFHRAIDLLGGQSKTAECLGCTQSNLSQLITRGSLLPSRHVIRMESASGVSRHSLRPDIYPLPISSDPAALTAQPTAVACDPKAKLQRKDHK